MEEKKLTPEEQKAIDLFFSKPNNTSTSIDIQAFRYLKMGFSKKHIAKFLVKNNYR